jgi:hypothetical protein
MISGRATAPAGHKPHRRQHPYALRGLLACGIYSRRMRSHTVHGDAYYRCRVPAEYALANRVEHPLNVNLREDAIIGHLDRWLAREFAPHRLTATLRDPAAAERAETAQQSDNDEGSHWLLWLGHSGDAYGQRRSRPGPWSGGAAVAAWPAVALVGSYELLMMVIHSSQVPADRTPETEHDTDPLQEQAAELFAEQLVADRVPSVHAIRAQLHVGQAWAQRLRDCLAAGAAKQVGSCAA